ncbi:hypothetical protein [Mycolicibacterium sediminis]|uniref:Uncharacterized protein n=1 Tax=Mycolicibacterium sediminis TaxID=1286180 RepID=A0A7I7QYR0_9MYCO|nr:hypothetical protein MSEDJ_55900 [Mycolicibacterium sediminis]
MTTHDQHTNVDPSFTDQPDRQQYAGTQDGLPDQSRDAGYADRSSGLGGHPSPDAEARPLTETVVPPTDDRPSRHSDATLDDRSGQGVPFDQAVGNRDTAFDQAGGGQDLQDRTGSGAGIADQPVGTHGAQADQTGTGVMPTDGADLFADDEMVGLRARWDSVQASFVDDPRECVQKADGLVSDVVDQLTNSFSHARARLEEQWARGEEASTEDLRIALKQYREFFDRLLAV